MITEKTNNIDEGVKGWVLYDGRCGMCSAGARRMRGLLARLGYRLTPLQTGWVVERLGRDAVAEPGEMLLLTRDGRRLGGVDAYLAVASDVWWGKPAAWAGRVRWVHRAMDGVYRLIARHRRQISGVCRLRPELGLGEEGGRDVVLGRRSTG